MNVWLCNPFDNLPEEGGRQQRYALLGRELVMRGHTVVWWTSDFSPATETRRPFPAAFVNTDGVNIRLVATAPHRANISFARNWFRDACQAVDAGTLARPDRIVVSLPPLETAGRAFQMRTRWHCPVVVDVQDPRPETRPPFFKHLRPVLPVERRTKRALQGADGVSAVSGSLLERAVKNGTGDAEGAAKAGELPEDAASLYPAFAAFVEGVRIRDKAPGSGLFAKRVFDLILVLATAPVWLTLMAGTALAVRIALGTPVLFRQERAGLAGRPFTLFKFRTMRDGEGTDEERLTRFGRFLRSTSLDELPELWNVVRGEMSLVGPRPLHTRYLPRDNALQARRHETLPGLTGWAQVHGRNALSWESKFAYDLWYVEHRSTALDLAILLRTVATVFARDGINGQNEATTSEFEGTQEKET